MADIFISYRRSDVEGWAGRLSDSLKVSLSRIKIFRDVDDIPPGVEFERYIARAVGSCRVLIVLIGRHWLGGSDPGRRRLDDPKDFIRMEIATALAHKVRVIPVLVGKASMPDANDLPDEIKPLARIQAYDLTDSRWADDCRVLTKALQQIISSQRRKDAAKAVAAIALVIAVAVFAGTVMGNRTESYRTASTWPPGPPVFQTGELSGRWVDETEFIWHIRHLGARLEIDVVGPTGQLFASGVGEFDHGRARLRFALSGNRPGELTLSRDGERLEGGYFPSPYTRDYLRLVLWRSD